MTIIHKKTLAKFGYWKLLYKYGDFVVFLSKYGDFGTLLPAKEKIRSVTVFSLGISVCS
jgi:hypothetical protein